MNKNSFVLEITGGNWSWYHTNGTNNENNLDTYVEENAGMLRSRFLTFIADLSGYIVKDRSIAQHLQLRNGFNLWWMSLLAEKSPYKSPAIAECIKLLALEEILTKEHPAEVILKNSDKTILSAVAFLCKGLNIPITVIKNPAGNQTFRGLFLRKNYYRRLPHFFRGFLFLAHYLTTPWVTKKDRKPNWSKASEAVFIFSYFIHLDLQKSRSGIFYSRQWEVLPEILQKNNITCNWLHHYLKSDAAMVPSEGLELVNRFNSDSRTNGKHALINSYADFFLSLKVLYVFTGLLLKLTSVKAAFSVENSQVNFWPLLKSDWLSSVKGTAAVQNLLWIFQIDKAMKEMPVQNLGLYLQENQGWERALIHAWKRHGHGTLIGVQHSSLRYWDLRYYDDQRIVRDESKFAQPHPHLTAINGPVPMRMFQEAGYKMDSFVSVEALRYLAHAGAGKKGASTHTGSSNFKRIILLGDILVDSTKLLLHALSQIDNSATRLTLKSHPGALIDMNEYPTLGLSVETGPLSQVLCEYDIAIAVGSTTAALDAYLAGLKVIVFLVNGELNLSPLRGFDSATFVKTPEELFSAIQSDIVLNAENKIQEYFWLENELPRWRALLSRYYTN